MSIHKSAQQGFTVEGAGLYNKGRPEYNQVALEKIFDLIRSTSDGTSRARGDGKVHVLELGAGTGKFTKSFLQSVRQHHADWAQTALHYTATEPSGFLSALARDFGGEIDVKEGTGASIPAADGDVSAVVVAQAFHWMATIDTLRDVHRVLGSGRPLVLIWNSYDLSVPWLRRINDEILNPNYAEHVPRQQNGKWRQCFATDEGKSLFGPLQLFENRYDHEGDEQLIFDRILSTSVIAEQSETAKQAIRRHIQRIIDESPELAASRATGRFTIPYTTDVVWTYAK